MKRLPIIFLVTLPCLMAGSPPGGIPELESIPIPPTPEAVMEGVLKLRDSGGDIAATGHFEECFDRMVAGGGDFLSLFYRAWKDAQHGTGRHNDVWAARLNDAAFRSCIRNRMLDEALEILPNTAASMERAGHFGRNAEIIDWWAEAFRQGGFILDSTNYPDAGPALAFLPQVRRRDIPVRGAFSGLDFGADTPRTLPDKFARMEAIMFARWGFRAFECGRWREGLEWVVWANDWSNLAVGSIGAEEAGRAWYSARLLLANIISELGLVEAALPVYQEVRSSDRPGHYGGRDHWIAGMQILSSELTLQSAGADAPQRAGELMRIAKVHPQLTQHDEFRAALLLCRALWNGGRAEEGMTLCDDLIARGFEQARHARVARWIETGRSQNVEEELLKVLRHCRASGKKIHEWKVYALYADFLEKHGRCDEALRMRREAVRLCRSFDLFARLPHELAKLAALLARTGGVVAARTTVAEAEGLLADSRLNARIVGEVRRVLGSIPANAPAAATRDGEAAAVDLQPVRSVVVPLAGMQWESVVTIANPGTASTEGFLVAHGPGMVLGGQESGSDLDIRLQPGAMNEVRIALRLAPGSYNLVRIHGSADGPLSGDLKLTWLAPGYDSGTVSEVRIEEAEDGVRSAVIQAGEFRLNPFYGVPIHHHFVDAGKAVRTPPLRFVASQPARVELYDAGDRLISVDAGGNGSLHDFGDALLAPGDGNGNSLLPLHEGAAMFKLVVYPAAELAPDGMTLNVEVLQDGQWRHFAANRLLR